MNEQEFSERMAAILDQEEEEYPSYNIFNRYNPNCTSLLKKGFKANRTYEVLQTYYMVWKPYTRYQGTDDLLRIEKLCRNKFKYERILITRETNAKRVHYNVLITSSSCPINRHDRTLGRDFRIHCQNVSTVKDVHQVIDYMSKEADTREFIPSKDSFIYIKN